MRGKPIQLCLIFHGMKPSIAFACLLLLLSVFIPEKAFAAHPLRLTDYSQRSRIELEVAYAKMKEPLPGDALHYLLSAQINVYQGVHLRLGLPFSGYTSGDGGDNFIRGNILVGASYLLTVNDWAAVGFGLRLYLPTYEHSQPQNLGLSDDPRRAALSHWHYRFQYAMEDNFPLSPEIAARFGVGGFYAQLEGSMTWAPEIRERDEIRRKDNVWILQYGLGLGYDILGYVELSAAVSGLIDPAESGENLGDVLGLAVERPRSVHALTVGPRVQYKWFVFRFEANIPLEERFRELLDPYYHFAVQVQFP